VRPPLAVLDYVGVCDPETLEPLERIAGRAVAVVAATFGRRDSSTTCCSSRSPQYSRTRSRNTAGSGLMGTSILFCYGNSRSAS